MLDKVKNALGITGNYQDDTVIVYINEVKTYLKSAGVSDALLNDDSISGVIARGVSDLWNGEGKFSPYFYERAIQLVCEKGAE